MSQSGELPDGRTPDAGAFEALPEGAIRLPPGGSLRLGPEGQTIFSYPDLPEPIVLDAENRISLEYEDVGEEGPRFVGFILVNAPSDASRQ